MENLTNRASSKDDRENLFEQQLLIGEETREKKENETKLQSNYEENVERNERVIMTDFFLRKINK